MDSPRESTKTGDKAIDVNWPTKLTHPRIRPSRRRPTWHKDIVKRIIIGDKEGKKLRGRKK